MEMNEENLQALTTYLQQTMSPDINLRKPAEDFLKSVEGQHGYAMLLLAMLGTERQVAMDIKVVKNIIRLPSICVTLSKIFDCSMSTGTVPDQLKIARVTPIYKKGDVNELNNYRPISVLCIFSKIFERCIYNRVILFLDKLKVLFSNQFGFLLANINSYQMINQGVHSNNRNAQVTQQGVKRAIPRT